MAFEMNRTPIYPDTSKPSDFFLVRNGMGRQVQRETDLTHFGYVDRRINVRPFDPRGEIYYELSAGLARPPKNIEDRVGRGKIDGVMYDILTASKLIATPDSVNFSFKDRQLVNIKDGKVQVVQKSSEKNEFILFDPIKGKFSYIFNYDVKGVDTPPIGVVLEMNYVLNEVNRSYRTGIPFESDLFYVMLRPYVSSSILLTNGFRLVR